MKNNRDNSGQGSVLVEVEDLLVKYGKNIALQVEKLTVPRGRILVIGPNASGKTTFIKAVLGLLRPKRGKIRILGLNPLKEMNRLYEMTTYVPDGNPLPGGLRLSSLVSMLSEIYGDTRVGEVVEMLGLTPYMEKRLGDLSKGTLRKASLLIALVSDKELIVIDEPFSGLDSKTRSIVSKILGEREGSLVVISHIPLKIEFDYLLIIEAGKIAYAGEYRDPAELGYDLFSWR